MSTLLLGILLWIPFLLVFITALVMFLLSGYKRGFWRSLISLGVTAVSAGLSLLVSKLVAGAVAGLVMPLIPLEDLDLPLSGEFAANLLQGLIGVTISLMIFSSLLLLFCIIGKTLSNHLGDDKMMPKNTGMKWAGLGIRLVDAVVFSLLLVLPLYGTLATYTPVVNTVIGITGEDLREIQEPLAAIEEHPVVAASKDGPMGMVYDGLADAQVGEGNLDIAGMADSVAGLMKRVEALEDVSKGEELDKTLELIDYLRTDVVNESWCYDLLIKQFLPELRKQQLTDVSGEERILVEWLLDLCDMSQKDFRKNANAILDFSEYVLENGLQEADMEEVLEDEAFLRELGKLINASEQAVELKNMLIRAKQVDLWDVEPMEAFSGEIPNEPVKKADYVQDALSFMMIADARTAEELAEAMRMRPSTKDSEDPFKYFSF